MAINVGLNDLRRSRETYKRSGHSLLEKEQTAACLLLFYAAECGLKAERLRQTNSRSTASLDYGHDLRRLAKDLRLPPSTISRLANCRSNRDNNRRIAFRDLHEAWRYGMTLDEGDEKEALFSLQELLRWCARR